MDPSFGLHLVSTAVVFKMGSRPPFPEVPLPGQGVLQHPAWEYGTSAGQRPLEGYGPGRASCLIMAAIHGDEVETTVLLSEALRRIPPESLKYPVILAANPDGVLRGTRCNARGVDLNRNFPAQNWSADKVMHKRQKGEEQSIELSPGEAPGSEPETVGLLNLIRDIQPDLVISLHSSLGCIDDPNGTATGQWISERLHLPLVPNVGYPTPGSFGSWAAEQSLPVITWELPADSLSSLRASHIPVLCKILTGRAPLA